MTVTVTTTRNSFAGNGNQGPHSIGFTILDATHIQVYWDKGSSSPGTPTGLSASGYLTKDTHYTVQNAGTSSNATITYIATGWTVSSSVTYPPSGDTIVVTRNVALTQGSDYTNNSTIDAETIENSFDKLTQITQQLDDGKDYSIKFASNLAGSTGFNSTADTAGTITQNKSDRISKILAFDNNGDISVTQELGTYKGNWATGQNYVLRDLVKQNSASDTSTQNNVYICTTAHASTGSYLTQNDTSNWTLVLEVAAAQASANTATTQATNAANSATAAANSATASANSATTASSQATTATTKASEASTSASNAASSATAAASSAANAASSYDSFDDRYLGTKSSNPTQDNDGNALVTGALYFNTTDGEMKVYDGSNWIAASAAQNATVLDFTYTLSGSDATISGSDDNSATLAFTAQESVDVFLNGVKLVPKIGGTANDYHLDTANTVTLTSTAVSGDVILVRVYKTFTVGDAVPASTGGTFSGNVAYTGNIQVDDIIEKTSAHGVEIDGVTLKDGSVATTANIDGGVGANIGNAHATGYGVKIKGASDNTRYALTVNNNADNVTFMRVLGDGNVGIGTASPISPAHISTSATDAIPTNPLAQNIDNNVAVIVNTNNSANYSGLKLETRTSGASAWLIANEWQSQYLGDLVFRGRSDGTNSSERLRIEAGGDVTVSSGSLIVNSGSEQGIGFGSTLSQHTLDDYEEGTWTPTWVVATVGATIDAYDTNTTRGFFRKIGDVVYIWGYISFSASSGTTGSDSLRVGGLPFQSRSSGFGQSSNQAGGVHMFAEVLWSNSPQGGRIPNSSNEIYLTHSRAAGGSTAITVNDMNYSANHSQAVFYGQYLA
jgi:hypothetical protein